MGSGWEEDERGDYCEITERRGFGGASKRFSLVGGSRISLLLIFLQIVKRPFPAESFLDSSTSRH